MSEIVEVKELCVSLEARLQTALERADGDSSQVVLVLDLDETCFTPVTDDGLATSSWLGHIVRHWAPRLELSHGMTYMETL